jgi:hypothetical protein
VNYWEIIARNLKKRGWSLVRSQPLILAGEQSSLRTHIATMENGSLCERNEELTAFLELESAIRGAESLAVPR